jgi:hypothetical protein
MVGTSRCIAATLFKFGGPTTLSQAAPSLCVRTSDSGFLTHERSCVAAEILSALENTCSREQPFLDLSEMGSLRLGVGTEGWWARVQGEGSSGVVGGRDLSRQQGIQEVIDGGPGI